MRAAGLLTWWNNYGSVSIADCVRRVRDAGMTVIIKSGFPAEQRAFRNAGCKWATEAYVYPGRVMAQVEGLIADVAAGAAFAVVNAEVEWEGTDGSLMRQAIEHFQQRCPDVELYGSLDTRDYRSELAFQRVMFERCDGVMPQCFPKACYPSQPAGYIERAFRDALDGTNFAGKPVLPTIQAYDGIGAAAVRAELEEVLRRGYPGAQAYTVGHANDQEWAMFLSYRDRFGGGDGLSDEQYKELIEANKTQNGILVGLAQLSQDQQGQLEFLGAALVEVAEASQHPDAAAIKAEVEQLKTEQSALATRIQKAAEELLRPDASGGGG